MTREEIMEMYEVNKNGIIKSLGKFEGEMIYAPHFYDVSGNGEILSYMIEGCGEYAELIEIDDDDRKEFPELESITKYILLIETDQGFVYCNEIKESKVSELRLAYSSSDEEEENE